MLFEPKPHDMFAEEIHGAFPDWNGDVKHLNLLLPAGGKPFERTQVGFVVNESTDKVCKITVPSLRALFRGNGELTIDRTDFKEEYIPFFYPIETTLLQVGKGLPKHMIVDDKFIEAFSTVRRRPDGRSVGYIHDVVWQLAADFLIRHVCSQNEFEACFRRLEQSARTWHTGPTSANYLASIEHLV